MKSIKSKELKNKTIKTINKNITWIEKVKDSINNDDNINEYGKDKINLVTNNIKDKMVNTNKKIGLAIIKNTKNKLVENNNKSIDKKTKTIKETNNLIKSSNKITKENQRINKIIYEQGKKSTTKKKKNIFNKTKNTIKSSVAVIEKMMKGIKSLGTLTIAGGFIFISIIIFVLLIGLVAGSIYGIFFSSEDTGNIKMRDYIIEIEQEMDNKIKEIKDSNPHDEVVIKSNKADWKEILVIYTIKVSNDNNKDVITIDESKKQILKEIFWDMNEISYEVLLENIINEETSEELKKVLHINIHSKTSDEMKVIYSFNPIQEKQYDELTNDKYISLWNNVIYGTYNSSEEITEWKQKGKEWSDIRLGNTSYTIDNYGCLVTSVAILIKKSGVSTDNINPFNPGTFVIALNNNKGFDSQGRLIYRTISLVVPDFIYKGSINLKNKSKEEKFNEIRKYYEQGYYLTIEVYGATSGSQHWIALDKIDNNTIYMIDPVSNSIDMWNKYDWNKTSRFVYFKANK